MKFIPRMRKLEQRHDTHTQLWAVFTIGYYDNPLKQEQAQQRLLDNYTATGAPSPTHQIFINETPSPQMKYTEGFLYAFSK